MEEKFKSTKINWNWIDKVGHPPRELATDERGIPRSFIVLTECGIKASYTFDDGSGFSEIDTWMPLAWAYAENER